jgi:hypothetical protein
MLANKMMVRRNDFKINPKVRLCNYHLLSELPEIFRPNDNEKYHCRLFTDYHG